LLEQLLAANGIGPADCNFQVVGSWSGRADALRQGRAAACFFEPSVAAALILEGFTVLDTSQRLLSGYLGPVAITRRDWLERNRSRAEGYVAAFINALDWLLDPIHRSEAAAILAAAVNIPLTVALQTYDLIADRWHADDPRTQISKEELLALAATANGLEPLRNQPDRLLDLCDPTLIAPGTSAPCD
jgi:ABC-type nitrate/sulfonate/bicarbonate transport system substrate-binding protein